MRWLLPAVLLAACLPMAAPDPVTCFVDADGDGYGVPEPFAFDGGDCDDAPGGARDDNDCDDDDPDVHPGVEDLVDDGIDQDCWGGDRITCFVDADEDGYGAEPFEEDADDCDGGFQVSRFGGDCDDGDPAVQPGAEELVGDGVDQDCDGADAVPCWFDGDGDGFGAGDPGVATDGLCGDEPSEAPVDGDCDDGADWRNPDAAEVCNGFDDDCDGVTDLGGHARAGAGATLAVDGNATWGALTVEFRFDGGHADGPSLVHRAPDGAEELRLRHTDGGWRLSWTGLQAPVAGPQLAAGSLAVVSDGFVARWFVEGVLALETPASGPTAWSADGSWTFETGAPEGDDTVGVDELRLWAFPRDASSLAADHCRAVPEDPLGNLKIRLPFEDGFEDASGSGNDATPSPGWSLETGRI
jgi:hypothetical protein